MKRINLYRPACPLCGRRRDHLHKAADILENVSTFLINLLKVGLMLLGLILMAGALVK